MTADKTIILIGPMGAGKSTVGELLSQKLGIPQYAVDDHRYTYYEEIGYDKEEAKRIHGEEGMVGIIRYWKPFEAYAVERVLATQSNCVIDFGAGHSVYEDPALFERVRTALEPYPHVILLLPSPDPDESVEILNARFVKSLEGEVEEIDPALLSLNAHFTTHPSNAQLAKMTLYTKDKSPEETCMEILEKLKDRHNPFK